MSDERPMEGLGDVDVIWRFRIVLQTINEAMKEGRTEFGDATRQLRFIVNEMLHRGFFFRRHIQTREAGEVWTFYEVVKRYIEGAAQGKWPAVPTQEDQYRDIVSVLREQGETMPAQGVTLQPLALRGEAPMRR